MAAQPPPKPVKPVVELFLPSPGQFPRYTPMLQGRGTNQLSQISARRTPAKVDPVTGLATIQSGPDFTVFIEKYNNLAAGGLRVSTLKLLDLCAIALTAQNSYRGEGEPSTFVSIHLDEYMRQCGLALSKPSKDKTRLKVKDDLEALYNTSIEWKESAGRRQVRDYAKMRLITFQGIKNSRIMVNFSPEIARYLTQAYVMRYPLALLAVSEKNPNAYPIGKKLLLHYSMEGNQRKGTANIISVTALLAAAPDIPSPEEVAASDRHFDRRITTALVKTLDYLRGIVISDWHYCNAKGAPLTDEQLQDFTFAVFLDCYIHFEVPAGRLDGSQVRLSAEKKPKKRKKAKEEPADTQ